ncbi:DUF547 domain-containing protein [soil metagenome]
MVFLIIKLSIFISIAINSNFPSGKTITPPSHKDWNELLQKYVSDDGNVDYKGFIKDKERLIIYLSSLKTNPPDKDLWSSEDQLSYWINAYNAFTVKLIVDNYPLKSIQDLNSSPQSKNTIWHKQFIKIGKQYLSLDEIEHNILRKDFKEPRIHFAINCASFSCPPLRNEAFVAERLEEQLHEMAVTFINDPKRNKLNIHKVKVSKIFDWFKEDFVQQSSLIDYLNKYSKVKIDANATINYMEYNWSLNEK